MDRRRFSTLFAISIGSVTAGLSHGAWADDDDAQMRRDKAKASLEMRFENANKSGDGHLTRAEARANMPGVYRFFDAIDTQKKGYITIEDIEEFARLHTPGSPSSSSSPSSPTRTAVDD